MVRPARHAQKDAEVNRGPNRTLAPTVGTDSIAGQVTNLLQFLVETTLILFHEILGIVGAQLAPPELLFLWCRGHSCHLMAVVFCLMIDLWYVDCEDF